MSFKFKTCFPKELDSYFRLTNKIIAKEKMKEYIKQRGFTLMELMVVLVIIAILSSIALPSYKNYVNKSRSRAATADLVALAVAVENIFQRSLNYPSELSEVTAWEPTQAEFFNYSYSPDDIYTLKATGINIMSGCVLTLTHDNTRTAEAACGFDSW